MKFIAVAQEKVGRPKRTGLWARHVNEIKLAQTLIRMMSKPRGGSIDGSGDVDDDDDCSDISQAENLLESYFAQVWSDCSWLLPSSPRVSAC